MSLPDPITLSIDEANDSNPSDHILSRGREFATKTEYYDEDHTVASRSMCTVMCTLPKQNGNFYGTLKTSVKFTRDVTVTGVNGEDIKVPSIAEANFSFPSGTDEAHATLMRQSLVSFLDLDSVMDLIHNQGQI